MPREKNKTVIGDSMSVTINFKWLLQLIVVVSMAVYGWWRLESRIQALERNMVIAMEEIELHNQERIASQQANMEDMKAQMKWYEKELNLNLLSWGKKKK